MKREIKYKAFDAPELDARELSMRLKMPASVELPILERCISEVRCAVRCAAVSAEVDSHVEGNTVTLGDIRAESRNLAKNLSGCRRAFVMTVTLGAEVDMLLRRKSAVSPSEHFICDAVASSFAESAADMAEKFFTEGAVCRPRFSPGYGDLSLSLQSDVLRCCDAVKLLGITLTDSLLMIPTKTITAIIGRCD